MIETEWHTECFTYVQQVGHFLVIFCNPTNDYGKRLEWLKKILSRIKLSQDASSQTAIEKLNSMFGKPSEGSECDFTPDKTLVHQIFVKDVILQAVCNCHSNPLHQLKLNRQMPSPSASSKFVLSVLKFLGILKTFFVYSNEPIYVEKSNF